MKNIIKTIQISIATKLIKLAKWDLCIIIWAIKVRFENNNNFNLSDKFKGICYDIMYILQHGWRFPQWKAN